MKTFILVMWVGSGYGGPSVVEFDSMAKCEAVLAAVVESPQRLFWRARGECLEVAY